MRTPSDVVLASTKAAYLAGDIDNTIWLIIREKAVT